MFKRIYTMVCLADGKEGRKTMTDLEKILKQLNRLDLKYIIEKFSIGRELKIYSLGGKWLGSLYFDLEGMWWQD